MINSILSSYYQHTNISLDTPIETPSQVPNLQYVDPNSQEGKDFQAALSKLDDLIKHIRDDATKDWASYIAQLTNDLRAIQTMITQFAREGKINESDVNSAQKTLGAINNMVLALQGITDKDKLATAVDAIIGSYGKMGDLYEAIFGP